MPDEIQAGLAKPISVAELGKLLERFLPRIHEAHEKAEVLRQRIANGERQIAAARAQNAAADMIEGGEALLHQLERELREQDYWLTIGIGLALAWGIGDVLRETALEEGWKPPPNSTLRVILPGMVNVAVALQ